MAASAFPPAVDAPAAILLVDDDAVIRSGIARLLRRTGHTVHEAGDGAGAVAAALANRPEIVLLDVDLPDTSGHAVCRRIRETEAVRHAGIIMISGRLTDAGHQAEGLEGGADGYIAKPVHNRELLARVGALLRLKRTEAGLRAAERALLEARQAEAMGIMAGGIAHDLNNLLMTIMGSVELGALDLPPDSPAAAPLSTAMAACRQTAELVSRLMLLSDQMFGKRTPCALAGLIDDALVMASVPRAIDVRIAVDNDGAMVYADRHKLVDALAGLIRNAAEAMPGGGTLTIHTGAAPDEDVTAGGPHAGAGRRVAIVIEDTGPGMPGAVRQRIFDPYFSTKARGAQRGTGLGLTVARAVVQRFGGRIAVRSEPGDGTAVTVALPLMPPHGNAEETG